MRREGYEFAVSKAEVLYHTDENGKKLEPMELAYVDVPDEYTGAVIDKLSQRKGEMINMKPLTGGYTRLEFNIPSRGLIGYRGEFMTDTRGNGIINTIFNGYDTYRGDIAYRQLGSLIAFESGDLSLTVCSLHRTVVLCSSDLVKSICRYGHRFLLQKRGYRVKRM